MGSGGDRPAADERKEDGSMVDRSSERVVSPECLTPAQIEAKAEDAAVAKVRLGAARAFVLAMFAGAFIAFGGLFFTVFLSDTTLSWGPQRVVGGLCFCLGLVLVLLCGAGCAAVAGRVWEYYDPAVTLAEEQLRADCEARTTELLAAQPGLRDKIADISANVELHYIRDSQDGAVPQAGDTLNLYVTVWPEACATREEFAALARAVMDACAADGQPYTTYRFDTLQRDVYDGMVTYELYVNGDWQRTADADALARSVQETYWYNGNGFTSYDDMHNYQQEMLRQNLVDEYYEKFGESPSAEWLDEQLAEISTPESAA